MNRRSIYTALVLLAFAGACGSEGDAGSGGYADVEMDHDQGTGTVTGSEVDPYGSEAMQVITNDPSSEVVTGDGREQPDTVYQANDSVPADTMP